MNIKKKKKKKIVRRLVASNGKQLKPIDMFSPNLSPRRTRVVLKKVLHGDFRSEVQPLPIVYSDPFLTEEVSLSYTKPFN